MSEIAGREPFEQVAERLNNEFLEGQHDGETPESLGQAFLEYVLKRERIRQGAAEQRTIERPSPWTARVSHRPVASFGVLRCSRLWTAVCCGLEVRILA